MPGVFVKRDRSRPSLVKDFRKSQQTERDWRKNRWVRMKGIKEYQNSFEAKKFYRKLGRFLATRELVPRGGFLGAGTEDIKEKS